MFQTTSIFIFHQLPSNPLSDLKCPLEVVLEKVQWMAVWHCPLTPCSQAMPDTHSDVFSQALMSEVRAILERVMITCLSNVIFIGSLCLPTHSYGHTTVITVPCENHPGSTPSCLLIFLSPIPALCRSTILSLMSLDSSFVLPMVEMLECDCLCGQVPFIQLNSDVTS